MATGTFVVGVTNSRLNAAKRGVAVEIASRLAIATDTPVCLLGADPTDRDVERHLPDLVAAWGTPTRLQVTRGPHHLEVANFARSNVCVVSVSDRESVELALPALRERFRFIVIDAPSRAGSGVGIADVLLDWLDALIVATGRNAGELAEARHYVEHIDESPGARHVDVRVLTIGDSDDGGLARGQLAARLATLPTIGHVPRLSALATAHPAPEADEMAVAFQPVIRWIIDGRARASAAPRVDSTSETAGAMDQHIANQHVANRLYRQNTPDRGDNAVSEGSNRLP